MLVIYHWISFKLSLSPLSEYSGDKNHQGNFLEWRFLGYSDKILSKEHSWNQFVGGSPMHHLRSANFCSPKLLYSKYTLLQCDSANRYEEQACFKKITEHCNKHWLHLVRKSWVCDPRSWHDVFSIIWFLREGYLSKVFGHSAYQFPHLGTRSNNFCTSHDCHKA